MRSSCLESPLARAQLDVLRIQLRPHFLFTTLHAVSALLRRDPGVPLASMPRHALDIGGRRSMCAALSTAGSTGSSRGPLGHAGARWSGREGAADTPLDDRGLARRRAARCPLRAAPARIVHERPGGPRDPPAVNG